MRIIVAAAGLVAGLLVGGTAGAVSVAHGSDPAPVVPWFAKHACAQEDSVNCAWDAHKLGDGRGHSFIVRQVPGRAHMVCVFYAERRFARSHDYCEATR